MKLRELKQVINKPYIKVALQIYLVVMMSIAFSFLIHNSEQGIISAQTDGESTISTCLEDNNGAICQEYATSECEANCASACVPSSVEEVAECSPGTCYDAEWGICSLNSPPQECNQLGGEFFSDINGNVNQCRRGCCQIGSYVDFITERACVKQGEVRGVPVMFDSEKNAFECLASSYSTVYGACITTTSIGRSCSFTTGGLCYEKKGEFYSGFLCSNPLLNTNCTAKATTKCFGEDVYWYDNCGNRENIYDANEDTWNNGKVLSGVPCNLQIGSDGQIMGQSTCGNCDYTLTSTRCGEKTSEDTASLPVGDVVCKDISCTDPFTGEKRYNGEKWCYYQGALHPDDENTDTKRSVVPAGSRHFLMECRDGIVHNSSCRGADYRAEICTESRFTDINGVEKSTALCRPNMANACIGYNTWEDSDEAMETCEANPDCYIHEVNIHDSNIIFDVCVPKYPRSFEDPYMKESICSLADIECSVAKIETHGFDMWGDWKSDKTEWVNKGCKRDEFVEELNDLCMSLGDCGASVNYRGTLSTDGVTTTGSTGSLTDSYQDELREYANTDLEEYIETSNASDFTSLTEDEDFINPTIGSLDSDWEDDYIGMSDSQFFANTESIAGTGVMMAVWGIDYGTVTTGGTALSGGTIFVTITFYILAAAYLATLFMNMVKGYGLSEADVDNLLTLAITGGAFIGISVALDAAPALGVTGIVIVALVLLYIWAYGGGDVHEYTVEFNCNAWTAPLGGDDCSKCYDDGIGCSKYACESLGLGCRFINEGKKMEACEYVPSDLAPPQRSPLYNDFVPSPGYEYVLGNYDGVDGYELKSTETSDGCIPSQELVFIGLQLNEPGRCTITLPERAFSASLSLLALDTSEIGPEEFGLSAFGLQVNAPDSINDWVSEATSDDNLDFGYGNVELYFGGNSAHLINHTHPLYVPSITSLGGLTGIDPNERTQMQMDVYCEDIDGHKNIDAYRIQMCVAPQDRTGISPNIIYHTPANGLTQHNITAQQIEVFTNYPSNCKWDETDQSYELMANSMTCETNPNSNVIIPGATSFGVRTGFRCETHIPMPTGTNNKTINVKCQDAAYSGISDNYKITLKRTDELKIDSITPGDDEELTFGKEGPVTVDADVRTSGGAENGKANCYYLAGSRWDYLNTVDGRIHKRSFNQFSEGDKILWIKCEDKVGNIVLEDSEFTIHIDREAPEIARIYITGNNLNIITEEEAVCKYSTERCDFRWENGTDMSIGYSTTHSTPFISGKTYHIRCKDYYGIAPGGCSVSVNPSAYE